MYLFHHPQEVFTWLLQTALTLRQQTTTPSSADWLSQHLSVSCGDTCRTGIKWNLLCNKLNQFHLWTTLLHTPAKKNNCRKHPSVSEGPKSWYELIIINYLTNSLSNYQCELVTKCKKQHIFKSISQL